MDEILIVDDNSTNLKVLELILKKDNYSVKQATSVNTAIELLNEKPIDLILTDINMPETNGYDFCKLLKSNEKLKDIPVIFISALSETDDVVQGFQIGGVDYITKPFKAEEVRARVKTHINLKSLQQELKTNNEKLNYQVQLQVKQLADTQMETIFSIAKLAQSRDDDTGKHLERVQTFCEILAEELHKESMYTDEINEEFIKNIYQSSPLHDIGKVGITDLILLKPGKLTEEEFEIMKTHVQIGAETLVEVDKKFGDNKFIQMGIKIARSHHERWDGKGYPDKLAGTDIPLPARIMSIADVYDALKSRRAYKEPFPQEKCVAIINEGKGTQFDPVLVDAFNKVSDKFFEAWQRLHEK